VNGIGIEDDRCLFKSPANLSLEIKLIVDSEYCVIFLVNDDECYRRNVSPAICHRIAVYAWGDRDDFLVDITDLSLKATL
jgi:hypothetical protein